MSKLSKLSVYLLIWIILMSAITPVWAVSQTTIPFPAGTVAPNVAFDVSANRAWASYYGGQGLYRWDKVNGTTKVFTIPASMEDNSQIQPFGIALDSSGNVWVCTTRHFYKFVPQDGIFTKIGSALNGGCRMVFDGIYIWTTYKDGLKRIVPSTGSFSDVLVANNCFCFSLTPFGSGLLVVDRHHKKLYEVSSSLIVSQRLTDLSDPYGIQCAAKCYLADGYNGGHVKEIDTSDWSFVIRQISSNLTTTVPVDVVIYQNFAGVIDLGERKVKIFNIPAWTSFSNISLAFTPLYGHVDINGNIYVGYFGSSGIIVIDNPFGLEPKPIPKPPCNCQGNDLRESIIVQLSQSQTMRKGSEMSVNVSLSKTTSGVLSLYAGQKYQGMELLAYREFRNSSQLSFSLKADWLGSKNVFAKFFGNTIFKSNVSNYITLTGTEPLRGTSTISSNLKATSKDISVSITNNDRYYMQNSTVFVQGKDASGVVKYFAWVEVQLSSSSSTSLTFSGEIPKGTIEVFVWKSMKEAIPLAEVTKGRN